MTKSIFHVVAIVGCFTASAGSGQDKGLAQTAPELMPVPETRHDGYELVERMGPGGSVHLIRTPSGAHQFVFSNRTNAEKVSAARAKRGASLYDVYLSLGGNRGTVPRDFVADHARVAPLRRPTPIPGFRDRLDPAQGSDHFGDPAFCQAQGGLDDCGALGDIRIGSITQASNICNEDNDLDDWEWYLNFHSAHPFDGSPFPPRFVDLGANGVVGFGRSSGNKNITIPGTTAGAVIVCDRPASAVDWFDMVIEEELFPGAWFILYDDGHFPGASYGIAFNGTLSHHPIRIRIRYEDTPDPDSEFFWAATY